MTQYFMFLDFYLMLSVKEHGKLPFEKIRQMCEMMKNAKITALMVDRYIVQNFK